MLSWAQIYTKFIYKLTNHHLFIALAHERVELQKRDSNARSSTNRLRRIAFLKLRNVRLGKKYLNKICVAPWLEHSEKSGRVCRIIRVALNVNASDSYDILIP